MIGRALSDKHFYAGAVVAVLLWYAYQYMRARKSAGA